jgi:hypothetical protein
MFTGAVLDAEPFTVATVEDVLVRLKSVNRYAAVAPVPLTCVPK